jgi:CRP/FNR family transcriptional regulator, cyclic AMP receptor protein
MASTVRDSQTMRTTGTRDLLTKVEFQTGELLFGEDDVAEALFVIDSGSVKVTKTVHGLSCHIETLGAADVLGESSLFPETAYGTRAVALEPTRCLRVLGAQLGDVIKRNPDIALRIMRKLSVRLIHSHFRLSNFALRRPMARLMHQLRAERARSEQADAIPLPYDLPEVLSLERGAIDDMIRTLMREGLVEVDEEGTFRIAEPDAFDRYLAYLELNDRFERLSKP